MAKWFIQAKKAEFNEIADKFNISPIISRIIRNRDIIGDNSIDLYLNGGINEMYSPYLLKDLIKAVDFILDYINNNRKIRIIGDYDIDGICATYILLTGLKKIGANVDFDIPDRISDGYGVNESLVERAYNDGIELIVTCDNGIAAIPAVKRAKELGMMVVVTDHHNIQEKLPDADAIVDPKQKDCEYPFKEICGAAVAFKLIQALYERKDISNEELYYLIQFAGIATIGDVVDLQDENRIFAKEALKRINNTSNTGLKSLIEVNDLVDKRISAYHIGFIIGPCLNASGRLDTAKKAIELFDSGNNTKAAKMASELKELNDIRKDMTAEWTEKAIQLVSDEKYNDDKVYVVYLDECHESLAGIIAGRIREAFYKPTIVLTNSENGIKGSGRSIESYDMFQELLKISDIFEKFGGHKMAAGVSLRNDISVEQFRVLLNEKCSLTEDDLEEKVWIDLQLPFEKISDGLIKELNYIEPFGKGNEKPVFAERNLKVSGYSILGKNRNVLKLNMINERGYKMTGICFNDVAGIIDYLTEKYSDSELLKAQKGLENEIKIAIIYYPQKNVFNGRSTLQAVISKIS